MLLWTTIYTVTECISLMQKAVLPFRLICVLALVMSLLRRSVSVLLFLCIRKVSLDTQGRLLINDRLKDKVSLTGEKEAVVFGNINHIEIWNKSMFEAQVESIGKDEVIDIMDELNGLGI